jgi:hypothetical protein
MAGIEPTPSKSIDWIPLSPCQVSQGGGNLEQHMTLLIASRNKWSALLRHLIMDDQKGIARA